MLDAIRQSSVLLVLMVLSLGCGDGRPKVVPVSGQVLVNGEPMSAGVSGSIQFLPENGRVAMGVIDPQDGTFTLSTFADGDGCLMGKHEVQIAVNVTSYGRTLSLLPPAYQIDESGQTKAPIHVSIDGPQSDLKIELDGELKPAPKDTGPEIDEGLIE